MRYRESVETAALGGVDQGRLAAMAGYALLSGIGMVVVWRRARQHWPAFWGASLVVANAAFLLAAAVGAAS